MSKGRREYELTDKEIREAWARAFDVPPVDELTEEEVVVLKYIAVIAQSKMTDYLISVAQGGTK